MCIYIYMDQAMKSSFVHCTPISTTRTFDRVNSMAKSVPKQFDNKKSHHQSSGNHCSPIVKIEGTGTKSSGSREVVLLFLLPLLLSLIITFRNSVGATAVPGRVRGRKAHKYK